jgi:integrase
MRSIAEMQNVTGAALMVGLLLGGQRATQLLRVCWEDYDAVPKRITLRDPKGRGGVVREHVLPVSENVAAIIESISRDNAKGRIFRAHLSTLSNAVSEIAADAGWTMVDVRRTVETRLAEAGVSKEHRGITLARARPRCAVGPL